MKPFETIMVALAMAASQLIYLGAIITSGATGTTLSFIVAFCLWAIAAEHQAKRYRKRIQELENALRATSNLLDMELYTERHEANCALLEQRGLGMSESGEEASE